MFFYFLETDHLFSEYFDKESLLKKYSIYLK